MTAPHLAALRAVDAGNPWAGCRDYATWSVRHKALRELNKDGCIAAEFLIVHELYKDENR